MSTPHDTTDTANPNDPEPVPTVQVIAWFDEDQDQWWFDRVEPFDPDEHDPASGRFVVDLPVGDWQRWTAALDTVQELKEAFVTRAGLRPDAAQMGEPCATFTADELGDIPGWDDHTRESVRDGQRCEVCGVIRMFHTPA